MINKLANDKMYQNSNVLNSKVKQLVFYCNKRNGNNNSNNSGGSNEGALMKISNLQGNSDRQVSFV